MTYERDTRCVPATENLDETSEAEFRLEIRKDYSPTARVDMIVVVKLNEQGMLADVGGNTL